VATVTTDLAVPADPASASTWTYTYSGDALTKVCPPTSSTACTTYTHVNGSLYPSAVLNAGPRSYWRLGENSGTTAKNAVVESFGLENATYANVGYGAAGPQSAAGSTATAVTFNGSTSYVKLLTSW
jgi:hypothetical protein